jgi:hypothetical protein
MNIVIPLLDTDNYQSFPKAFVDINGKPLIQWCLEGIGIEGQYHFVISNQMERLFRASFVLESICENLPFVMNVHITERTNETENEAILLGRRTWNKGAPLMVVKYDQFLQWDGAQFAKFLAYDAEDEWCGRVVTFKSNDPHYTFLSIEPRFDLVERVCHPNEMSDDAFAGITGWATTSKFLKYASETSTVLDALKKSLQSHEKCGIFELQPTDGERIWILETPGNIKFFEAKMKGDE